MLIQTLFWSALIFLSIMLLFEISPQSVKEGFVGVAVGDSTFWSRLVPRRSDVGPELEEDGLFRDERYFSGYVDVQRYGQTTDFCRVIQRGSDEKDKFLACALGGTENLSSTSFRSPSVKEGWVLGRDDYMRDVDGDGRADYCRVVKQPSGEFRTECNLALEVGFGKKTVPDSNPPKDIKTLLEFYQGCIFWLRLRDDMLDYAQNLYVNTSGNPGVVEVPPKPEITEGLMLNGSNQYLRIGDDPYLGFGSTVQLRNLRAIHLWVRFDEFTNNAHIFDFGNGAGNDNIWLGILNRGNLGTDVTVAKNACSEPGTETLPDGPSGAQPSEVTTPQELMRTSSANVEEYTCEGFAVAPRLIPRLTRGAPPVSTNATVKTADLCYEVWDKEQRKMRIVVKQFFELGKWTHVVITAVGTDSFRPDIAIYKNASKVFSEPAGWLPQQNATEINYIGKSNWGDVTSQYANKDELFKGSVFDIRGYNQSLNSQTIKNSYNWGKKMIDTT
jgi:hypothetical protein